jgi:hypothetical protein
MAIKSTVLLDLPSNIQSITYNVGINQVDKITFASNAITFSAISSFNLIKSDLLIYIANLKSFSDLLFNNFTFLPNPSTLPLPPSNFQIAIVSLASVIHLHYIQTSLVNQVYNINYSTALKQATIPTRAQTTITLQEFYYCINFLQSYKNQINLN